MLVGRARLRACLVPLFLTAACGGRDGEVAAPTASASPSKRLVVLPQALRCGQTPRVQLASALGATLASLAATVDPCVVRVGGEQASIALTATDGGVFLDPPLPATVDVLVGLSARPADGPSLHAKAILSVRDEDGHVLSTTAVTQRIGLRAELTPLIDPSSLFPKDELPLRLSVDLGTAADVELTVERQPLAAEAVKSQKVRTRTDGFVIVPLPDAGRYLITAQVALGTAVGAPEPAVTTLSFVVEGKR